MSDTSSSQKIYTKTSNENVKITFEKEISTCENNILNMKKEAFSALEEIDSSSLWQATVNKNSQYDELVKENAKYTYELFYVDGETQYTRKQIEIAEHHIKEIEILIKESVVNLKELEHEKGIALEKLVNKHNAIKKATKYYKTYLNLYIRVEQKKNILQATICFFTQTFNDTYSFVISKNDNDDKWILNSTKPDLQDLQFATLLGRFNSTNNMPALLCTVRNIFLIYKNSRK